MDASLPRDRDSEDALVIRAHERETPQQIGPTATSRLSNLEVCFDLPS